METMKKMRVSKALREHLNCLAQAVELIAECTPEKWQEICGHTKEESLHGIAQALRNTAQK